MKGRTMRQYTVSKTPSSKLRGRLDFPVVDADAHIVEARFVLPDFLKQVGGPGLVAAFDKAFVKQDFEPKSIFWPNFSGSHTIDRATTMLPALYARRLEEAGVDFCTLYSTIGFRCQVLPDDEVRAAACRALNMMYVDMFKDQAHKMRPAAIIPMHTPEEAIAELEFAVGALGMQSIMTCNEVLRPYAEVEAVAPELSERVREYTPLALDSPHDYDPFWRRCAELKVVPTGHSINYSGTHGSRTNYVYNRVGLFASFGNAGARALFMGGVTKRFPELNFAFLEGGVWWAVALYNDLVEFWEKRNVDALKDHHDPAKVDFALMEEMFEAYGNEYLTRERMMGARENLSFDGRESPGSDPGFIDDWKYLDIERAEDIRDLFADPFYFGCEADDSMNYTAFNAQANKFGVKLKALFSSDLGHWDVVDFGGVLAEAHEQTEKGLMTEDDFRDFVFTNPVTLQTRVNPDFFKGTVVEAAVDKLLAQTQKAA